MNITLIDYGIGNIKSIQNAFKESGVNLKLSREKEVIYGSEGIILPGVGAFAHGMKNLIKYDLIDIIKETEEKINEEKQNALKELEKEISVSANLFISKITNQPLENI